LYAAQVLSDWLPNVIQAAKPWMSDRDIEKGTKGLTEVGKALEGMKVGIVCLTPENLDAAWILYEAGALSKTFSDDKTRLCTYLLGGLQPQNVKPPLSMFQWTRSEKEDTKKLVQTVNTAISEEPLPPERLNTIFETWWPQLEVKFKAMPAPEKIVDVTRDPNEMINEILELCRQYLPNVAMFGPDDYVLPDRFQSKQSGFNRLSTLAALGRTKEAGGRSIFVKRGSTDKILLIEGVLDVTVPKPGQLMVRQDKQVLSIDDVDTWGYGKPDLGS